MRIDWMDVLGIALLVFLTTIVLFFFYMIIFVAPVSFYTQAECLRNGYPKAKVSIGLERYCMNLDGTVTVRVEKVSK